MKLYSKPGACSTADHIALQWTGQPFEVEVVTATQIKEPGFLALNPAGSVPVIVDGDFVLTQNAAIMGYIADSYPDAGLAGDNSPRQRAEATRWLAFCNSDLHPSFLPLFAPGLFMSGADNYDTVKELAAKRVRKHFETADKRLGEAGGWLAGFRSFADPYLYVTMGWAKKLGIDLTGLDHLAAFHQRMSADPGVQAALKAEGLM
ncbi:glutathione S-transferase [Lysobacter oculi]|uniref:Glutathione S-transferase n=1 Tax=Solilutibacter oculi TaxID=2698682 RepID=A0A344J3H5_9GAMM|nr:glutathione S-transferase N-terminal domain-containing protein [Lysobacter oculi]AXA83585.1 glutathione S-transferase [Lysobacter oculi]